MSKQVTLMWLFRRALSSCCRNDICVRQSISERSNVSMKTLDKLLVATCRESCCRHSIEGGSLVELLADSADVRSHFVSIEPIQVDSSER